MKLELPSPVSTPTNAALSYVRTPTRFPLPTTLSRKLFFICFSVLVIIFLSRDYLGPGLVKEEKVFERPGDKAANSTLGFEAFIALSTGPSWRTRGLDAAADLTNLTISFPTNPGNTPAHIAAFAEIGAGTEVNRPPPGSAAAWLAHLDLLKYVVTSGFNTALIIEDDVDFDVHIKEQMRRLSPAMREFVGADSNDTTPYGLNWDVFWIGHCGEATPKEVHRLQYPDPTRMSWSSYAGWTKNSFRDTVAPEHRSVQDPVTPVCTNGYAVTALGAKNVLRELGSGADEGFDVGLQHACTSGKLKCVTVNPELMHHYQPPKDRGYQSLVMAADGDVNGADEATFEHEMGTTANLVDSARCASLWGSTCPTEAGDQGTN